MKRRHKQKMKVDASKIRAQNAGQTMELLVRSHPSKRNDHDKGKEENFRVTRLEMAGMNKVMR